MVHDELKAHGPQQLGDVVNSGTVDMSPGSPAHKAQRWEDYQGDWSKERWSKQYDTNMQNNKFGLGREAEYREILGGVSKTEKTKFTYRQIDIFRPDEMYMGQLKTGKLNHGKQARIDIEKDAWLVDEGYTVESLSILQQYLIDEKITKDNDDVNDAGCYFGEVVRKNYGGKWICNLDNDQSISYGKPVIAGHTEPKDLILLIVS